MESCHHKRVFVWARIISCTFVRVDTQVCLLNPYFGSHGGNEAPRSITLTWSIKFSQWAQKMNMFPQFDFESFLGWSKETQNEYKWINEYYMHKSIQQRKPYKQHINGYSRIHNEYGTSSNYRLCLGKPLISHCFRYCIHTKSCVVSFSSINYCIKSKPNHAPGAHVYYAVFALLY